jgi:hypothetical protein
MDEQQILVRAMQDVPNVVDTNYGPHPNAPGCKRASIVFENGYLVSIIQGWISMDEVEVAVRKPDGNLLYMVEWDDEVRRGWTPETLYAFINEVARWPGEA